jgi:hypothetical protein
MTEEKQNVHSDVFTIEAPKKKSQKGLLTIVLLVLFAVVVFFILKNPLSQGIKTGDSVIVTYKAVLDNGTVLEERDSTDPYSMVVGTSPVTELNTLVLGMGK